MYYKICGIFILCNIVLVRAVYEKNPFLSGVPLKPETTQITPQRDINQWNVAVLLPPGSQLPLNNSSPPGPSKPGFIWVQVPISVGINNPPPPNPVTPNPPSPPSVSVPGNPGIQQPTVPITTPPLLPPTQGINLNGKCLSPRGQFPSTACNRFINCWDGVAVEQTCPPELLFNPKGYCDYAGNVDCKGKPIVENPPTDGLVTIEPPNVLYPTQPTLPPPAIPSTTTSPPSLPPVDSALRRLCLRPRGQFPGTACNKYVNCWDDVVIEQECPDGLFFSSKGYCDFAQLVECNNAMAPINITVPKSECPLELGTFRDPRNCSIYHTCVSGKIAATYECPVGYSFNKELGVCDFSYRVNCMTDSNISDNLLSSTNNEVQNQNSADCPADTGTFRDKNRCNVYYTCVAYKIVARYECPEGYNFNDNIGVCDFAYRVDCSKQPVMFHFRNTFVPQIPPDFMDKIEGCTPGVVFRLNQQCSLACRCREGLAEFIQCPDGLAYDSPTDKCLPLNVARC